MSGMNGDHYLHQDKVLGGGKKIRGSTRTGGCSGVGERKREEKRRKEERKGHSRGAATLVGCLPVCLFCLLVSHVCSFHSRPHRHRQEQQHRRHRQPRLPLTGHQNRLHPENLVPFVLLFSSLLRSTLRPPCNASLLSSPPSLLSFTPLSTFSPSSPSFPPPSRSLALSGLPSCRPPHQTNLFFDRE